MGEVICFDDHGRATSVSPAEVTFRPAVYGVLLEHEQVLLRLHPATGLWLLPGGLVDGYEKPTQAVRRHFRAASSVAPVTGPLLLVEEQYRIDAEGRAWHLSVLYYAVTRPSAGSQSLIDFENAHRPEWAALDTLTPERLQFGYDAIRLAQARQALQ
jgi:ADP-ribose pyrophosphatase YjhB (NUDIX family)